MTMADTVAVMNGGVIEQLGAPAELYENPRSTFVANFLGQSNLIEGDVRSRAADITTVAMHGIDVSVPTGRVHTDSDRGWVGIRPEKVLIGQPGEELDAPGHTITGGVVSDVSFVGVSTQYLVRMPWGQELQVFQQNTGRTRLFRQGESVELSWRPEYAFLLDREQDADAGAAERAGA
jgi:spermidine/putrescine transport system ATP-binding protein